MSFHAVGLMTGIRDAVLKPTGGSKSSSLWRLRFCARTPGTERRQRRSAPQRPTSCRGGFLCGDTRQRFS